MLPAKSFKLTIFQKLFFFLLLIVILFYGISMYISYISEQDAKTEITRSSTAKANLFMSLFENDIERIMNVQNQFVNDTDLLMLSNSANTMDDYEKYVAISNLQKRMALLMSASKYIDNVYVQIPVIKRVIAIKPSIDELADRDFNAMRSFKSSLGSLFLPKDNRLFINMPYPEISNNRSKPLFNLNISISKNEIKDTMLRIFSEKGGGCILTGLDHYWEVTTDDVVASGISKQVKKSWSGVFPTGQWKKILRMNSEKYWVTGNYSRNLGTRVIVFVPEDAVISRMVKYRYWNLGLSLISMMLLAIYAYWANNKFGSPMKKLVYAFRRVEKGELAYTINHKSNDEFAYLYSQFNSMIQKADQLIRQVYEQQIIAQQAELKQLQYQINPHFLYNSIYLVYRMASVQDHENVMRLSKHLGGYYKYITRSSSDNVPLKYEVAHALDYVEVQSIRFTDRIKVEFGDIPEGCENMLVPPLILQPVVENAYGHGLDDKGKDGLIRIGFVNDGQYLLISVEDNGKGIEEDKLRALRQEIASSGSIQNFTGLLNVHRRLFILYGGECGLDVKRSPLGGLCVVIKIAAERSDANV